MRALWLPDILTDAGFDVHVEPGWDKRGSDNWGPIKAVVCHHTAWPLNDQDYPSLRLVRDGRGPNDPSPVPGPLSQLGLGRSGKAYVIASGRANHAGIGSTPKGVVTFAGSRESIGIEAEHPGGSTPWTPKQYDAYVRMNVAIVDYLDLKTTQVVGHKEWAPTRKPDPNFPMALFRADIERARQPQGGTLAHLTDLQQRQLADFIDNIYAVGSDSSVMRYMIPWFRKLSGLTPAALAELEESDEIAAVEAKIDQLIALGGVGGLTVAQADARYVRSGQPVRIT